MANKEAVFSLRVDTGNSVKDVQSFDQSINKLNKDMQDTQKTASQSTGTDNFSKKLDEMDKKLASGTLTFREMTKLMKEYQTVAAQTGSQSPIGDRAIKAAASLKDTLTDLETRTKLLSSDYIALDTAVAGIQTGTAAFQGFQSVVALTGVESEALVQTMVKLQAAQGLVNSVNQIALALNKDAILGIQLRTAAQKAYTLIVGQSTIAMKSLQAAVGATSIGQKILAGSSIAAAAAMKVLNFVMSLNPVFLIIGGITSLIGLFAWFITSTEEATEANDKLNSSLEKQNEAFDRNSERIRKNADNRRRILEANGANEEKLHQDTLKRLKEEEDLRLKQMKNIEDGIQKRTKVLRKALEEGNDDLVKDIGKQIKEDEKKYQALTLNNSEYNIAVQEENKRYKDITDKAEEDSAKKAAEAGQKAAEAAKKRREDEYKAEQDRLKNLQSLYNEYLANIEAAETEYYDSLLTDQQREEQAVTDKFYNLIEQAKQHGDDTTTLELAQAHALAVIRKKFDDERLAKIAETEQKNLDLLRSYQSLVLSEQENELIAFEDQQKEKSKALSEALAAGVITEQQFMEAQLELEKQYAKKREDLEKATEEAITEKKIEEINKRTEVMNNYLNASLDSLNSLNDLNTLVSDLAVQRAEGDEEKQEKLRKQAFNRGKVLQVGIATIQGIQAVQNAYTTALASPLTAVNPAYPFIQAGLAAAVSAANIAKIASAKYGGTSGATAPSQAASAGGATGAGASTFTANTNTQQTDTSGLLNGQGSQQGGVTQVVVVESDITNVQNKVSAQQALSTY